MENPISIEATYLSTYFQYTCIDILKWRFWTKICPFFFIGPSDWLVQIQLHTQKLSTGFSMLFQSSRTSLPVIYFMS